MVVGCSVQPRPENNQLSLSYHLDHRNQSNYQNQKGLPEHLHLCEQLCQTEVDVLVVQQRSSERLSLPDCHIIIIFVNILLLLK